MADDEKTGTYHEVYPIEDMANFDTRFGAGAWRLVEVVYQDVDRIFVPAKPDAYAQHKPQYLDPESALERDRYAGRLTQLNTHTDPAAEPPSRAVLRKAFLVIERNVEPELDSARERLKDAEQAAKVAETELQEAQARASSAESDAKAADIQREGAESKLRNAQADLTRERERVTRMENDLGRVREELGAAKWRELFPPDDEK